MYSNNFVDGLITKEKYGSVFVRFLKIVNFLVHLGIIAIFVFTVLKINEINEYNLKITETKKNIEIKRSKNNINEAEKEWEIYYYKILAVKEQLQTCTHYGYVLKDFGVFIPTDNSIIDLSCIGKDVNSSWYISKDKLKDLVSFFDYAPTLNSAFEKSEYITNDFLIETMEKETLAKREINALKLKITLK